MSKEGIKVNFYSNRAINYINGEAISIFYSKQKAGQAPLCILNLWISATHVPSDAKQ